MDQGAGRLQEQGRCSKCKKVMTGITMTCQGCLVYKYCSQECLEADKKRHVQHCHLLGIQTDIHGLQLDDSSSEKEGVGVRPQVKDMYSNFYGDLDDSDDDGCDAATNLKEKSSTTKDKSNLSLKSKENDIKKNSSNGRERKGVPGEKVSVTQDIPSSGPKSSAASSDEKPTESGASKGKNQQSVLRRCWKCKKESYTLKACNRCHTALYCNKDCQRLHLKAHEDFCLQYHYKNLPFSRRLTSKSLPGSPGLEDFETLTENASEIKECSKCKKKSDSLKKCGRCCSAAYCNKDCQKVDYKGHKDFCRRKFRFEEAKSKIYPYVTATLEAKNILLKTEFDYVRDEYAASLLGIPSALLVEITGPYFHIFRYGIEIQDVNGNGSFVLFYTQTDHYPMPRARSTIAVPLPECLNPGNFLLIMEPAFHFFMDGTVGFRINSIDEVHFIQMK